MKNLLAVAIGGALGSLVRYLTVPKGDEVALFAVNIAGVVVAGLVAFRFTKNELLRIALIPGFAGGLTTFSSVAVMHAQHNSIKVIAYFYLMILVSSMALYLLKPQVKS
ncbi:MAG: putative fluoride ion transporter CrcB [Actinomycetota bacterium]